jgi:hypothetical protein
VVKLTSFGCGHRQDGVSRQFEKRGLLFFACGGARRLFGHRSVESPGIDFQNAAQERARIPLAGADDRLP